MKTSLRRITAAFICLAVICLSAGTVMSGEAASSERVIRDNPQSMTGNLYGYLGRFDPDEALDTSLQVSLGNQSVEDVQVLHWEDSAILNSGMSSLVIRDSYIRGETAEETKPLEGNPGSLLVGGNIRATLAMGNSQNFYLNSTIVSRNWGALSTDAAKPAPEEGGKELSLYTYGTDVITMEGGYGAYSDLFCNLNVFGSHIQGAEIGIISGTYGKVSIGNIIDGENNQELQAVLTNGDKEKRPDKEMDSIVEGGRNALMIHSVNLPPYWEYEGYSEEELPLLAAEVKAHDSILRTDLYLDQKVPYDEQQQAYIDHTKGSVILIKSTNVEMTLDGCQMLPDKKGTGDLIQTVYNNDTMFMNAVPENQTYPGIHVVMKDMKVKGNISHEDYQRDFKLDLNNTVFTGAINEYDFSHWKEAAQEEGFTDYCVDESYETPHGMEVSLKGNAVWNVKAESVLSSLEWEPGSIVNGVIYLDGVEQTGNEASYRGNVVVMPGGAEISEIKTTEPETKPEIKEPETKEPETPAPTEPAEKPPTEAPTVHVHNWVHNGGYPAGCTQAGATTYICTGCGEEYSDYIPALGHNYVQISNTKPTCEYEGYAYWECTRCGDGYTDWTPATGHDWQYSWHLNPTCWDPGADVYTCGNCGAEELFNQASYPALGHSFYSVMPCPGEEETKHVYYCTVCAFPSEPSYHTFAVIPNPESESLDHMYYCTVCGYHYYEPHTGTDPCYICGYSGPVG